MTTVKAKPIETPLGRIYPSLSSDRLKDGREINSGSCFMGINASKATFTHNGKEVTISVMGGMDGATILLADRYFVVSPQMIIRHAIEHGFLGETLSFEEATK